MDVKCMSYEKYSKNEINSRSYFATHPPSQINLPVYNAVPWPLIVSLFIPSDIVLEATQSGELCSAIRTNILTPLKFR